VSTWDGDLIAPGRHREPLAVVGALVLVTAALVLVRDTYLPNDRVVLPIWLALVAAFNVMTLAVLVSQYRAGSGPRVLALTWALVFSAVAVLGGLLVLPGVFTDGPIVSSPGATAHLYAVRHLGVPALVVVALVPWRERFAERLAHPDDRTRLVVRTHAVAVTVALVVVWAVIWGPVAGITGAHRVVRDGAGDTWPATTVMILNLALLAVGLWGVAVRRRLQGIEAWAIVALVADCGDTVLTYLTTSEQSLGWYGARVLGLASALVLLAALLRESNRLQSSTRLYAHAMEAQNATLTEAQALRDHLVAVVTHDMRSPLTALQGYLEMLEDDELGPDDAQRLQARSRLLTRRLIMLTEDLLASATPTGLQVIPEQVDLRTQLEDCLAAFPDLIVILHCPRDLQVMADPLRLQQILVNLVRNAQKYGAEPVRITGSRLGQHHAQIWVSDAGKGVDPSFVPTLFDRYTRGDSTTAHGSGIGLSVARSLAEQHGGSLNYRLADNAFVVELPAVRQRANLGLSLARNALTPSVKSEPV